MFVTVGTDHHRFDRLVTWIDDWAATHRDVTVLLQRGTSKAPAVAPSVTSVTSMPYPELLAAMAAADAVVAQGGPAGIVDARSAGHCPIVVARRPELGEHVDGHQVTFTRWMASRGQIKLAETAPEMASLLDLALAGSPEMRVDPDDGELAATIDRFAALVDPLMANRAARRRSRRS